MVTCALSLSKRKIAPFDRLRAHQLAASVWIVRPHLDMIPIRP
jgi:hypothetical protein